MIKKLLPALFLFYFPTGLAKTDPSFTWMTLTSPHFFIHYHQGEEALAQRTVVLAENIHAKLVARIKSEPESRTNIVLLDAFDDANGWATPQPYNLITLYTTPPLGEPGFGAQYYDDWMRELITHEYTHIVQLGILNGASKVLNSIFGNWYYPNSWQPVWLIEGLAVYEETELTGGGRNRSPATDMVLRMAMLEHNFPPISHASNFTEQWPNGDVPYLFGGEFIDFLANKYGREKLADVSLEYARRPPFYVEGTASILLGSSYPALWEEWKSGLSVRYEATRQKLAAQGLSSTRALTPNSHNKGGYKNLAPSISPDGKLIAYYEQNADKHPAIHLMNLDGGDDRTLVENETSMGQGIAWAPDSKGIYYTKIDMVRNSNLYNDLYFYDLERGEETRLSEDLRARDAAPSPDGTRLVFVTTKLGKTRLASVALPRKKTIREQDIQWLGDASDNQFETPRFSPDGQKIVVGVRQPDGYKDIWILDNRGNKLDALMHDRALDGGAVWSADGRSIYFSSDRSGIFNIYVYDLADKKISQVSNVLGGAFMPSVTPDGSLIAYADYSSRGYDIRIMNNRRESWNTAGNYRDPYPNMSYDEKPVITTQSEYDPLPSLRPRFWIPAIPGYSPYSGLMGGVMTFGADAVQHHSYFMDMLYGPQKGRLWYDFSYLYDGLEPSLQLNAQDTDLSYSHLLVNSTDATTRTYVERNRTLDASLTAPLFELDQQQELILGYRRKTVSNLSDLPPGTYTSTPAQGKQISGRVEYLYNDSEKFGYSISPEDGRSIALGYEQLSHKLGSDFNLKKYTVDWHEYIDLPIEHHVLLLRSYYGRSTGDVLAQRAFQLGGDTPGDMLIGVNQQSVYLRGYPINEFRGQKVGLFSAEYRFPIKNLEWAGGTTPFFFKRLHGAVFAEAGNAWDNTYQRANLKRSVGIEARLDMSLAFALPITVRVGVVKALDDLRTVTPIANLWLFF